MTALRVESCGPATSFQDAGRIGQARFGISRSGAMDQLALAEANALVGNSPDVAAIELLLMGGVFALEGGPARLALAGARMATLRDGVAVPPSTAFELGEGERLSVGPAAEGVFGYLAVAGGFDMPPSLGSLSLQARAAIGGLEGRALAAGDRLALAGDVAAGEPPVSLPPSRLDREAPIRVVLGPQDDHFDADAIAAFLATAYTISPEADRMGFRLQGPPIAHLLGFNIVSDGIVAGSVQVPGNGIPIVMMADHQTTGGYPKIATVASADLRLLAQRRPGDAVRFAAIAIEEAEALARERAALVAGLPGRLARGRAGLPDVEELLALNLAGAATDALSSPF